MVEAIGPICAIDVVMSGPGVSVVIAGDCGELACRVVADQRTRARPAPGHIIGGAAQVLTIAAKPTNLVPRVIGGDPVPPRDRSAAAQVILGVRDAKMRESLCGVWNGSGN